MEADLKPHIRFIKLFPLLFVVVLLIISGCLFWSLLTERILPDLEFVSFSQSDLRFNNTSTGVGTFSATWNATFRFSNTRAPSPLSYSQLHTTLYCAHSCPAYMSKPVAAASLPDFRQGKHGPAEIHFTLTAVDFHMDTCAVCLLDRDVLRLRLEARGHVRCKVLGFMNAEDTIFVCSEIAVHVSTGRMIGDPIYCFC